jgi:hypothetical protein
MARRARPRRELDADIEDGRDPRPMSVAQALASDDPVFEIGIRLAHKPIAAMSGAEKAFWSVDYFLGDTLDGGLLQAMMNSTGDFLEVVGEFAARYGPQELVEIVAGVHAAFPGGRAPADRDGRVDLINPRIAEEIDPFEELTERFYKCEDAIRAGLLRLVENNRSAFDLEAKT